MLLLLSMMVINDTLVIMDGNNYDQLWSILMLLVFIRDSRDSHPTENRIAMETVMINYDKY